MNIESNNIIYNQRSNSFFQNLLLEIRARFYEKEIISSIFSAIWSEKSNWKNIDIWGWAWHKTIKLDNFIIWKEWTLELIEPSSGMREKAKQKLQDRNIVISKWHSRDLSHHKEVENIYCNQMTHHLDLNDKKLFFNNAFNALKKNWKLFILDTTIPDWKALSYLFTILIKYYKKYIWKNNTYYNITTQEYITLLEEVWFEIDIKHTRHFYLMKWFWQWCTKKGLLHPFMTQIVAIKP